MITPGNWSVLVCVSAYGETREIVTDGLGAQLSRLFHIGVIKKHDDAALVAAAPDLLAAASAMLEQYQDSEGPDVCDCRPEPQNEGHVCPACMARRAIAKAKGEVYER